MFKGKTTIPLQKGQNKLAIFSKHPLLFSINGKPEYACGAGKNRLTVRCEQPTDLQVDPADAKSEYSIDVDHYNSSSFETINDDPPPQPKEPANWLAQVRKKVAKEMGVTRENFGRGYEADHHEWEEDQLENARQAQQVVQGEPEAEEALDNNTEPDSNDAEEKPSS